MGISYDSDFTHILNGEKVSSKQTKTVINPATKKVIAEVPIATEAQLDDAVKYAAKAFPAWRDTPLEERQKKVDQLGDLLNENKATFSALLTREQGKPKSQADFELEGSIHWLHEISKQSIPEETLSDTDDHKLIVRRVPLGVCAGIVPWNFPILLMTWKIAPALVTGNTMIIKPSPFTPLCDLKVVELFNTILPPGVLQIISGDDNLGPWITAHPGIKKVAFTGSTATGKLVMKSAASTLKRLTLELGGNDPAIILPDVDCSKAAKEVFWASFQNNAQFCNATKRVYVHEKIYDEFLAEMVKVAKSTKVGDGSKEGTELGPIQNEMQYNKVKTFFDDCVDNGYKFAVGGKFEDTEGYFVPVSLIDNPPEDSKIMTLEPFGPILPLVKWSDEADVIRRANDTPYGLGCTVWGKDLEAVERIGRQIEAGTVWLNCVHLYSPVKVFAGAKESGLGAENGEAGLSGYLGYQTIELNKKPAF